MASAASWVPALADGNPGNADPGIIDSSAFMAIGSEYNGNNPLDGFIDDVLIYGRALSKDEIDKSPQQETKSQKSDHKPKQRQQ